MKYSASTGGFYLPSVHGAGIPSDAVEITDELYRAVLVGNAQGMQIKPDANGAPVLRDRPPMPAPIPTTVTLRQAKLALLGAGLLDSVDAAIAASGRAAQIEWASASAVDRNSLLVASLAGALGLDSAALDSLFTAAAAL